MHLRQIDKRNGHGKSQLSLYYIKLKYYFLFYCY